MVVVADDIGREMFDFYDESEGPSTAHTPQLNELAANGVTFDQSGSCRYAHLPGNLADGPVSQ